MVGLSLSRTLITIFRIVDHKLGDLILNQMKMHEPHFE